MALVTATAVIARRRKGAHLEYVYFASRVREIDCATTGLQLDGHQVRPLSGRHFIGGALLGPAAPSRASVIAVRTMPGRPVRRWMAPHRCVSQQRGSCTRCLGDHTRW